MTRVWQLQEAENRFSEIVNEAISHGPQLITEHGVETVIILAYSEYRKLTLNRKKISEFFQESPLAGAELDLTRDTSPLQPDIAL